MNPDSNAINTLFPKGPMRTIRLGKREDDYLMKKAKEWDMSFTATARKLVRLGSIIEGHVSKGDMIFYQERDGTMVQLIPLDLGARLAPMVTGGVVMRHCCLRCGWTPIEGLSAYLEIHGDDAVCIRCKDSLVGQKDPYIEGETCG